jgi:hypothetical protein
MLSSLHLLPLQSEADLILLPNAMFFNKRERITELAVAHGLPSLCLIADMTDAGLLMSYGPSLSVQFRRAAA